MNKVSGKISNTILTHSLPVGVVSHYILSAVSSCSCFPNEGGRYSDIQMKIKRFDSPSTENYINPNTVKAPNIKHNSPEVKDVCYFADRVRHMLDVKINHLRTAMEKSDTHFKSDMYMIRIQALEWTQGQIQDLILNNVTTDYPFYDNDY
jgi:hypothetical protein